MIHVWQLQEAKNKLSRVIDDALTKGPQTITRRGRPVVVIVSVETYRRSLPARGKLSQFFAKSPLAGVELDLERADAGHREGFPSVTDFLLDTCVISELVSTRPSPRVVGWVDSKPEGSLWLSVVTLGEVRKGISLLPSSRKRRRLETWLREDLLSRFEGRIVSIGPEAMLSWGDLVARLEKGGRSLPVLDSVVAALALAGSFRLVTRNVRHFEDTGVDLFDPWSVD